MASADIPAWRVSPNIPNTTRVRRNYTHKYWEEQLEEMRRRIKKESLSEDEKEREKAKERELLEDYQDEEDDA